MKTTWVLFVLQFLFAANQSVFAQNTFLWSVKSPTGKSSYLLGTYHQMGNSFIDSYPQIRQALLASDAAIFESVDSSGVLISLLTNRKDDFSYKQHLSKPDLEFLEKFTVDWVVKPSKLSPSELYIKLTQEYFKTQCGTIKPNDTWDHFDKYLIHIAQSNNIEIAGLENDSLQTAYINSMNGNVDWGKAKKPIHEWITNIRKSRNTKQYCRPAHNYMNLNFDYQFEEKCGENIMLKGRNEKWMKILPDRLNNQNTFVAVGLMHLYGDCGLIMQLKSKGYTVIPVSLLTAEKGN